MSEDWKQYFQDEDLLTIKDRINYTYLLSVKLLTIDKAVLTVGETSSTEMTEAIELLRCSIPDFWKDDDYREEVEKAKIQIKVDNRPTFCGRPMDEDYCRDELGIQPYIDEEMYDPFAVHQAIINLLQRRKMIGRTIWKEIATGKPYESEEEQEITEEQVLGGLE